MHDELGDPGPEREDPRHQRGQVADLWPEDFLRITLTAQEFCAIDMPRARPMMGPLLAEGQRMMVVAQSGHGKTTFITRIVKAAIRGEVFIGGWEGVEDGGARALMIDLEQDPVTAQLRFREAGLDIDGVDVDYLALPDGMNLREDQRARRSLEAVIREREPSIVVIDPLFKAFIGEDSNDEATATACMSVLDHMRMEYRFALIMGMHSRKPQPRESLNMAMAFGSTAWLRGAEIVIGLERLSPGVSRIHNWKDRIGYADQADPPFPMDSKILLTYDRQDGFAFLPAPEKRVAGSLAQILEAFQAEGNRPMTIAELTTITSLAKRTVADTLRKHCRQVEGTASHGAKLYVPVDDEDTERWEQMATEGEEG